MKASVIAVIDGLAKNRHPRESGDPEMHSQPKRLDSRFRGNDEERSIFIFFEFSNYWSIVLSGLIFGAILLSGPRIVGAETAAPTETDPVAVTDPCASIEVSGDSWLDQTHDFVDKHLCEPAVWFDNFFGEERILDRLRPGTFVKWSRAVRWVEGDSLDNVGDITVRWRLPQLETMLNRARIFIVTGSDSDQFITQPGQPLNPAVGPATKVKNPTVGVQLDFFTWFRSVVSLDTGLKVQLPLDPFLRIRYQYTRPLGDIYLIRMTEITLWRYVEQFQETSQLDLERSITTFMFLRWSNYATYTDGSDGIIWNTGLSLIKQLTNKSAISYDASMWGENHPHWTIENYRVGSRYRRNFYRPWLFFEFEPEVTWPKGLNGKRDPVAALMVTLEVQFGK
jgi:hypothetical protein